MVSFGVVLLSNRMVIKAVIGHRTRDGFWIWSPRIRALQEWIVMLSCTPLGLKILEKVERIYKWN